MGKKKPARLDAHSFLGFPQFLSSSTFYWGSIPNEPSTTHKFVKSKTCWLYICGELVFETNGPNQCKKAVTGLIGCVARDSDMRFSILNRRGGKCGRCLLHRAALRCSAGLGPFFCPSRLEKWPLDGQLHPEASTGAFGTGGHGGGGDEGFGSKIGSGIVAGFSVRCLAQ